jgi:uncharacterized protein (TIGR00288 family)
METDMSQDRVMLLIDADNVSLDVIEQAVPWVHKHFGGPHVLRAYCTAESAVKHQGAFKRLSIRPMVNLAAGKNSTDIALAVDAMEMVSRERHDVVVIASSDSDFAPLVARLREKGCRVVGIGQEGKTGDETVGVYDDYEVLTHRKASQRAAPPAAAKAPAKSTARGTARKAAAPRKSAAKKTAAHGAPAALPMPEKAQAILDALPALAAGDTVELRVAAERLRDAGLMTQSGSSTKLFGQFPDLFELLPDKQPNHVRRRASR